MKTLRIATMALVCLLFSAVCRAELFSVPKSIRVIESEAWYGINADSVFIPASVLSVADDSFAASMQTVYGVTGTEAQRYAIETGRSFIPVDMTRLRLSDRSVLHIAQGAEVFLEAACETDFGTPEYSFNVKSGAESLAQSGYSKDPVKLKMDMPGTYDLYIRADSGWDQKELRLENAIIVEAVPMIKSDRFEIERNESIFPLNEPEKRPVTLCEIGTTILKIEGSEITGLKTGTARVQAVADCGDGLTAETTFIVQVCEPVNQIRLDCSKNVIYPGEQIRMQAAVLPENALNKELTWSSSDESVLQVDEDGVITAKAPGEALITAGARSGVYARIGIVVAKPAEELEVPDTFEIDEGISLEAPGRVLPEDAYDKVLTGRTTDSAVAYVSGGRIYGAGIGECEVTLITHNGIEKTMHVSVVKPVTSVKLNRNTAEIEIYTELMITAEVLPEDAFHRDLVWTSSDETVATVDENGCVSALSGGTTQITATAASGKYAVCSVKVNEIKPTSAVFDRLHYSVTVGGRRSTCVDLQPLEAQNRTILYESDDESIVTVDEYGVLYGVKSGRTTVRCISAANGTVTDTCTVDVVREDALRLEGITIGINPGHQSKAILSLYPIAPGSSTMKAGCKAGATGVNSKVAEHVVNLQVSLKLRDMLEAAGASVVMTRTTNDVSINNIQRAAMLNDAEVDMAIQVHCDGSESTTANGMSAYYRSTGNDVRESKAFAETLLGTMVSDTGANSKGVHICNTYMSLNYSYTPAMLVELGFLSNPTEDALLNDDAYQNQLSRSMFEAICSYYDR